MFASRFAVLLVASLAATILWGQSGNSVVSGSVKDASGAAVPSAKVKVSNVESGVQFDTVTNDAGLYRVGNLLPGSYKVDVEAQGFDALGRGPLTLAVSQTL